MTVTIYHNTACGPSRKALAMIRDAGIEPTIVEYLKTPPNRAPLCDLAHRIGIGLHGLLRQKAPPYAALGITPSSSDEAILDALQAHAILLDRPIVVTDKGTRLCRPAERVREIL